VIVPSSDIEKYRYKSTRYKKWKFSFSCNLHEWPSCILHFALLRAVVWRADMFKDCLRVAKFLFSMPRPMGYKTFQIPRVQRQNG
jgi:hypothetical protein